MFHKRCTATASHKSKQRHHIAIGVTWRLVSTFHRNSLPHTKQGSAATMGISDFLQLPPHYALYLVIFLLLAFRAAYINLTRCLVRHHFFGGNFSVKFSSCRDQCKHPFISSLPPVCGFIQESPSIPPTENMKFSTALALLVIAGIAATGDALPARKSELSNLEDYSFFTALITRTCSSHIRFHLHSLLKWRPAIPHSRNGILPAACRRRVVWLRPPATYHVHAVRTARSYPRPLYPSGQRARGRRNCRHRNLLKR